MEQRRAARLAWPVLGGVLALWLLSRVLVPPPPDMATLDPLPWHVAMAAYGVVGAIIVNRRPDNVVGWLFLIVGLFDPLSAVIRAPAIADLGPAEYAGAEIFAWVQSWIWAPSLGALGMLLWVFPTGRVLPGWWRWGARTTLAAVAILLVPTPIVTWPYRGPRLLFEDTLPGLAGIVPNIGFVTLMVSAALGVVSLGVRLKRSSGDERQQLKWFFYAAAIVMAQAFTDIVVLDGLGVGDSLLREVVSSAALTVLPASAAIAMLKYRLYDIDHLINRTVVYGALTACLAGAYLAVVAVVRLLTADLTGDTTLAVAGSTLAVAALFRPARQRIQEAVDRRFNRARYDAANTVAQFSNSLRDEVQLDTLSEHLLGVVTATMQPRSSLLWLSPSGPEPVEGG